MSSGCLERPRRVPHAAPPQKFVEGSFIKRVAESMLEELVRRCVNIFIAGIPTVRRLRPSTLRAALYTTAARS